MGQIGIMADIHGNLAALETALEIFKQNGVDRLYVCGDIVGYGRQPNECCDRVRDLKCPVVAGNHDWAVAGLTEYEDSFSSAAVEGVEYTRKVTTPENLKWLAGLPLSHTENDLVFVHASPFEPELWRYLKLGASIRDTMWQDLKDAFRHLQGRTCFVGHSHTPALFLEQAPDRIKIVTPTQPAYSLAENRAIIDVGSIGQPRSRSKKSSLVIFDDASRSVRFLRF